MTSTSDYLIIGSGVCGTSIASYLSHLSPSPSITVIDRSPDGFVSASGASNDLNKIIRADYTDPTYCSLAKTAISKWRADDVLRKFYHEVGVLFRSQSGKGVGEYVDAGIKHAWEPKDVQLEVGVEGKKRAYRLTEDSQVEQILSGVEKSGLGEGLKGFGSTQTGYFNPRGGWAEANNATRAMLSHAITRGVKVVGNCLVTEFVLEGTKVVGVKTSSGTTLFAKNIVIATGAWTSDLLTTLTKPFSPSFSAAGGWLTRPSAQCVAILRLTAAEAEKFKGTPVVINFSSGFYLFEPVLEGGEWQMKIAYHSNGFVHPRPPSGTDTGAYPGFEASALEHSHSPATDHFGTAESCIPPTHLDIMLDELHKVYPSLAQKERVVGTRICWYSDTLDENWILDTLDHHPALQNAGVEASNVWVVSGDSGHAFKFLPVIGELWATVKGLQRNNWGVDLKRFTWNHQQSLHKIKQQGGKVTSADSNRFVAEQVEGLNARARL
ncbi:fructosyl amino acid oxidase [Pseudozyma hubeiensis SY62]|uniref:Fructosyl amino acid oxidase n=1 Tax=Pseudozyma hubeiensis (strain SY62) TaxID=1305764 RepID=R9PN95_PSEHS|nr:fructosyl amino acid oxidase [Pseudozyma hubeiensis SY62]GAC99610.1 fructosyl amino acid oxidase [Pseudozyma hubeiensis SY62]